MEYIRNVLLASLDPAAAADIGDAVRISAVSLSRGDLVGAATSVAERVASITSTAGQVAVPARPTAPTVRAITGCLIAGVSTSTPRPKLGQWTSDDTLVHGLPLFHVHGLVLGLLGSLRIGNRFIHTGKPTPQGYADAKGTLYFGVPTVWSRVIADPATAQALRPARLLVSGSAPLPVPVFERLAELTGHRPVERYGAPNR